MREYGRGPFLVNNLNRKQSVFPAATPKGNLDEDFWGSHVPVWNTNQCRWHACRSTIKHAQGLGFPAYKLNIYNHINKVHHLETWHVLWMWSNNLQNVSNLWELAKEWQRFIILTFTVPELNTNDLYIRGSLTEKRHWDSAVLNQHWFRNRIWCRVVS